MGKRYESRGNRNWDDVETNLKTNHARIIASIVVKFKINGNNVCYVMIGKHRAIYSKKSYDMC